MNRVAARGLGIAAILLGGSLLGSAGCGSVTAKKTDGGGAGGGSGGVGGGGECNSDADCVLYPVNVGNCCGTCQPKSEPEPGTVSCLIACLTPLKSCSCVSHQCKGSAL